MSQQETLQRERRGGWKEGRKERERDGKREIDREEGGGDAERCEWQSVRRRRNERERVRQRFVLYSAERWDRSQRNGF